MKIRAHIYVSGWVQGVFFRANVRSWASSRGVSGWVRNLPNGKVEAVLEGEKEDVERVIGLCKKGPPGARVEDVDVEYEKYLGEFTGFEIRYGRY
ncbi:MAG: acylphosphatase [bacterium]|nr:acylphosphatase [bacterium]